MGVFRDGQQSITLRLKSAPQISGLVQQLLAALERDLEKTSTIKVEEESSYSTTDSESSSDRSSALSYRLASLSDDDDYTKCGISIQPRSTVWTSIQGTITSLQQLAMTVRLAGAKHRQERIQRFKNLERNKQVYEVVERCAREMVDFRFPKSSKTLRERTAESIATRQMRFLYLEQHQKKTSTLTEPNPESQTQTIREQTGQLGQQQDTRSLPRQTGEQRLPVHPSVMLSDTERTKLDPKQFQADQRSLKRPESVSSVKLSTGNLPSKPKLSPDGTSFSCPYCFLVCPAREVSSKAQWMSHLIHDFEPFLCVFDDCSSPFNCADTYAGWLVHMQKVHTEPRWHCWHCGDAAPFFSAAELKIHLERYHYNEVTDSLRPTLVKHSLVYGQHALQDCPFCGGFPDDIENDHPNIDGKEAQEALEKHVRDHLVSLALFLVPVEAEQDGLDCDDTQSEAQRGNDSEHDLDGVSETGELKCQNYDCDCNAIEKDSGWDMSKDMWYLEEENVKVITQLWNDIMADKATQQERDDVLLDFAATFTQLKSPLRPLTQTEPEATQLDLQERLRILVYDGTEDNIEANWGSRYCEMEELVRLREIQRRKRSRADRSM
ncbi:hypothetical protein NW768_009698 [Fusarium equiseti]|uniref:C2H2-type domain-containing protein n=1 Tax=Fusarium equiseti TaxID=61235 RepID=A0ABQ8R1V3_FUSEQ|nr:hypothetical protein NW768_009698 [Fusarium equiseti]